MADTIRYDTFELDFGARSVQLVFAHAIVVAEIVLRHGRQVQAHLHLVNVDILDEGDVLLLLAVGPLPDAHRHGEHFDVAHQRRVATFGDVHSAARYADHRSD